jgi:hypothetical protein
VSVIVALASVGTVSVTVSPGATGPPGPSVPATATPEAPRAAVAKKMEIRRRIR